MRVQVETQSNDVVHGPFHASETSLSFKIGRNAGRDHGRVSHITITLDPSDTYTVEFIRCNTRAKEVRKVLASYTDVYVDMLHNLIESETGLVTSF